MSAILPMMTGKACDIILLRLFEASGVPLESTPSFGQLRSIRVTLEPLARKMSFQDKVYQYHIWMKGLLGLETEKASSYDGIPNEETAAFVIRALGKLALGDSTSIVAYYGFKGAAWVAAYARYLLDLPVCVLKAASDEIPLSGNYRDSRIRLYIYEEKVRCEIHTEGKLEQFLVPNSLNPNDRVGWTIDTDKINLLQSFFLESIELRQAVSTFVGSLAYYYTEMLAYGLFCNDHGSDKDLRVVGIIKYSVYCLPAIRQRARRILQRFGFDADETSVVSRRLWCRYIRRLPANEPYLSISASSAWPRIKSPYTEVSYLPALDFSDFWQDTNTGCTVIFSPKGLEFIHFLWKLAAMASWLALTDWGESLHTLSVTFLEEDTDIRWTTNS